MTKYQELETRLADAVKRGCERHPDCAIAASKDMLTHYRDHLVPMLSAVRHRLRQELTRRSNLDFRGERADEAETTQLGIAELKIDGLLQWLEDQPIQDYLYIRERK